MIRGRSPKTFARVRRRSWIVAFSLVCLAPAARADVPSADDRARAQTLFESALADVEGGRYATACPKFAASHAADPKTSTLLNLGSCYENLGRTASAWAAFREAEGLARKTGRPELEASARERADALDPKLVRLTIDVAEANRAPGLTVARDGSKLTSAEWGVGIPVDDGDHEIVVEAPQRKPWRKHVVVHGTPQTIEVPVLEAVATAPPTIEEKPNPSWWTPARTTGVVLGGVGALAMGTGLVLALVAKSNYDDAKTGCAGGRSDDCSADAVQNSDSARSLATAGTVVIVSGAAVFAAGAAIVLFAPSPKHDPRVGFGPSGIMGRW